MGVRLSTPFHRAMSADQKALMFIGSLVLVALMFGAGVLYEHLRGDQHFAIEKDHISVTIPGGWEEGRPLGKSPAFDEMGDFGATGEPMHTIWEAHGHESAAAIGSVPLTEEDDLSPDRIRSLRSRLAKFAPSSLAEVTLDGHHAVRFEATVVDEKGVREHAKGVFVEDEPQLRLVLLFTGGIDNAENNLQEEKVLRSFHVTS